MNNPYRGCLNSAKTQTNFNASIIKLITAFLFFGCDPGRLRQNLRRFCRDGLGCNAILAIGLATVFGCKNWVKKVGLDGLLRRCAILTCCRSCYWLKLYRIEPLKIGRAHV